MRQRLTLTESWFSPAVTTTLIDEEANRYAYDATQRSCVGNFYLSKAVLQYTAPCVMCETSYG